jgi:hypothetical protein
MQDEAFTSFSKTLYGEDLDKLNELRSGYQQTAQPAPQAESETSGQSEPAAS